MKPRIGDAVIKLMVEQGIFFTIRGDGILAEAHIAARGADALKYPHPMNRIDAACRALDRDVRFKKYLCEAHDLNGKPCKVRSYRLKPEFIPVDLQRQET